MQIPRFHFVPLWMKKATLASSVCLCVVWLLAGCSRPPVPLRDLLPGADTFGGWTPTGEVQTFDRETLYDLVDGQADSFFVYGFEQAAVQTYEEGDGATLRVTLWQLSTPADAYGLFTSSIAGTPVAVGNDGDADPGRRVTFWQDRYFADLYANPALPDVALLALAEAVSARLPAGGQRPALIDRLPAEGLVARSPLFFHEEISIQNEVWLGGENLLGLSRETEGVLARYEMDGRTMRLLVVQYPGTHAAAAGLTALQAGQVEGLVAADLHGKLLGAVFGQADPAMAGDLLAKAVE
jgi:hypothetical protein